MELDTRARAYVAARQHLEILSAVYVLALVRQLQHWTTAAAGSRLAGSVESIIQVTHVVTRILLPLRPLLLLLLLRLPLLQ